MQTDLPTLEPVPPHPLAADLWTAGVARLQVMLPLRGFAYDRWAQLCIDCASLFEHHGAELRELGWTAKDLFGVHPNVPATAVRCYGLGLLLSGGHVSDITASTARITRPSGAKMGFTRVSGAGAVPVWTLDG